MRADGFEHVLNGDVAAVRSVPAQSIRRREATPGNIEPGERHRRARDRLVTADQDDEGIERLPRATSSIESAMTSRLTSDARMPGEPIVMPSEIDTVLNSIGVPPAARMPALTRSASSRRWIVARADLDPGVGDADEGCVRSVVGEARRRAASRAPVRGSARR